MSTSLVKGSSILDNFSRTTSFGSPANRASARDNIKSKYFHEPVVLEAACLATDGQAVE